RSDLEELLKKALPSAEATGRPGVVHLWNLDAPATEGLRAETLEASQTPGTLSVIHLAQAWSAVADSETGDLFVVTRGAQAVGDRETPELAQTPVWGLGRVMVNEYPRLRTRLLDLGPTPLDGEADALLRELTEPDEEEEIALRGQARYVHRYV